MKEKVCQHIVYWVEDNLTTTNTVADLEKETGYSRSTLERWFREKHNMTPGDYLYRRRMHKAAILLRMTALPVTEISEIFHYHSSQNFARAFQRFAGMTPSRYRKCNEWKLLPMQLPLFINQEIFADSQMVELPNLYIQGIQTREEAIFHLSSHNPKIKKFMCEAIEKFSDNGITDVHIAGIAPPPSEIPVGRNDRITVFLYAGALTTASSEHIVHIPGGTYVKWNFSSSFEEYYTHSKVISIILMQNMMLERRQGYDYIHFHSLQKNDDITHVVGSLYIPVKRLE